MGINRVEHPITGGNIAIVAGERQLPAFWAYPKTGGTYPGVAVLGDGLSAATRQIVNRLAQRGLYVIAPDLNVLPPEQHGAGVNAALSALHTHNHCKGGLALVGIGAGGSLALHIGQQTGSARAIVAVEPDISTTRHRLQGNRHPTLVIFAGPVTPELQLLRSEFTPRNGTSLLVYPDACPDFLTTPQTGNDQQCEHYAWTHIMAFLEHHLTWPQRARAAVI